MFARVKKSGNNQYLQIVENRRENGKVAQRVIVSYRKQAGFKFQRTGGVVPLAKLCTVTC